MPRRPSVAGPRRRVAVPVFIAACFAAWLPAVWGAQAPDPKPGVKVTTTGHNSERLNGVPIERRRGAFRNVMQMRASELPDLRPKDALQVSSELSVTTDCTHESARCAGRPYDFSPRVETRLVLTGARKDDILARDRRKCLQRSGQRQHHCQIIFVGIEEKIRAGRGCAEDRCKIEVQVRAWNRRAAGGERLVIGGNAPNGRIIQDKGRVNAIRIRPAGARLGESATARLSRDRVPPDLKKRVIHSLRLDRLREGEQLEATVRALARVGHLSYPALVGTQIVLAERASGVKGKNVVKRVASLQGEITEGSGTNCTQVQSPCPILRTGVIEMREDARARDGEPLPLFVNVVVRSTAKRAMAQRGDAVRIEDRTGLRVRRYPPTR